MRKCFFRSLIIILCVLFACSACHAPTNSKETSPTTKVDLEIVYKKNQICYAVTSTGEDTALYTFNAAAQPIFDLDGKSSTATDLQPGMLVSLEYDGYILETYPAQFSGVSSIHVSGVHANSVEFLGSLISGMFPTATPEEVARWEITFSGDDFLSAKEKRALEYKIQEEWTDANVFVDPEESLTKKTGHIKIDAKKGENDTVQLTIRVDSVVQDPTERKMTVSIQDGKWTMGH
ncbi:MAG: hypothetical protein II657_05080 [Clostridiales bacterium]|nr:hypothetical protein [Clostridiales bacterium]